MYAPPPFSYQVHKQLGWCKPSVGMAARAQILEPATMTDIPAVALSREFMDFTITDKIKDRLDFLVRPKYIYMLNGSLFL